MHERTVYTSRSSAGAGQSTSKSGIGGGGSCRTAGRTRLIRARGSASPACGSESSCSAVTSRSKANQEPERWWWRRSRCRRRGSRKGVAMAGSESLPEGRAIPARIVIADDHGLVRQGVRGMLAREEGLEVVGEAEDGREAVEICSRLRPDLVLMDVRMPQMDGLAATRKIKQGHPETSVLMVTMQENPDYLLEAVKAGAAGYVLKGSPNSQIMNSIRRVLIPFRF